MPDLHCCPPVWSRYVRGALNWGSSMAVPAAWGLAALLGLAGPAEAQDCRLALVLALDVSASVDLAEDRLQRIGLARALLAPEVVQAFLQGAPVALFVFEWAGPAYQVNLTPGWRMVEAESDLAHVAAAAYAGRGHEEPRRARDGGTALGTALVHAAALLGTAPPCAAQTVDVSGDGENNQGLGPSDVYGSSLLDGVTVNALVIDRLRVKAPRPEEVPLVAWFRAHVLHGPDAFWVLAEGFEDYERAIRAKLRRELELPVVSQGPPEGPRSPGWVAGSSLEGLARRWGLTRRWPKPAAPLLRVVLVRPGRGRPPAGRRRRPR